MIEIGPRVVNVTAPTFKEKKWYLQRFGKVPNKF